ncbi:MAG: Hsp20 family protein [Candidatus Omnitrophica bacterium]|nr:Hsp20 family protein [Candidatus Omnitrophota bacterium]
MKKSVFLSIIIIFLIGILCFRPLPCFGEQREDLSELKKQFELLQKRVDRLEEERKILKNSKDDYIGSNSQLEPFSEITRMQEEMDRMFRNSFDRPGGMQGMFSSDMSFDSDMDIKDTGKAYEITLDIAGLDKNKVNIDVNEHSLTIKGEEEKEVKEETKGSLYNSKSFTSFMKTIPLPTDADTSNMKTEKEGGRIVIRLPKKTK